MGFFRSARSDSVTSYGEELSLASEKNVQVDRIIELGNSEEWPTNKKAMERSYKVKVKRSCWQWLASHRNEMLGILLVLVGGAVVAMTFLYPDIFKWRGEGGNETSSLGPSDSLSPTTTIDPDNESDTYTAKPFYTSPPAPIAPLPTPSNQSPTITTTQPVESIAITEPNAPVTPTLAPTKSPTYTSIFHRLSEAVNPNLLLDPETPYGMAYNWIRNADELRWSAQHPSLVQRFVLATFYFATGGRRTVATWTFAALCPLIL